MEKKDIDAGCSSSVIPDGIETIASFAFSRCKDPETGTECRRRFEEAKIVVSEN